MLIQSGIDLNISFSVLDPDANAPCSQLAPSRRASLPTGDTVMRFGEACDLITIEIENVDTRALFELEKMGRRFSTARHH